MRRPALAAAALAVVLLPACTAGTAPSPEASAPPPTAASAPATHEAPAWRPEVGASFQIQLTGTPDLSLLVDVYILDGESATADQVRRVRQGGARAVCYLSVGSFEDWRHDAGRFPDEVVGKPLPAWPGERWLDVTRLDVLLPIMADRIDACAAKGFDAIDPDNTDAFQQDTGFAIDPEHQVAYQRALAREAHARGLAIGLKNNPEQLDELADVVDFAVNEECVEDRECALYDDFLASGKAVLNIEYAGTTATVCPGRPEGMSTVIKTLALGPEFTAC